MIKNHPYRFVTVVGGVEWKLVLFWVLGKHVLFCLLWVSVWLVLVSLVSVKAADCFTVVFFRYIMFLQVLGECFWQYFAVDV